ncbi:uncharacterized protein B0H18DRAFT_888938 [Fomitopsis serialis]|uniref:uncharacterized protein n=1 Tax=Fomitopsis serialis TaxID=139415 RepID=UPI002008CBFF|nr:uncharacterized protein B0H18DRAFT_888938 [Neoantrodia serialis]KAH9913037.1 hypothetical protein B0H18DRAFT_888938 [Neoantrodia serialis]
MEQDVSGGVKKPFWVDLPYTDIHLSITPDVLHQLYQGVFKHLVSWCQDILGSKELDRRLRTLPKAYGIRHFKHGISSLSQITGKERKDMARVLLACLIGKIPKSLLLAFRSLLDFIYLAQYPTHDDDTLGYMTDALNTFHKHKDILVKLGIRDHLNIPKFHSLLHYVDSIRLFGTTDNYNTEMFERLHIDFAKDAWRASNHRDEFPQMVKWISRREKMMLYELHCAPGFTTALATFINDLQPSELRLNRREFARTWLPFDRVDVYHKFRFSPCELSDGREEIDVVKCIPGSIAKGRKSRFDTVIVLENEQAESTGVQGTRAGRVKVIFTLPKKFHARRGGGSAPAWWPKGPLAYVEWYTRFSGTADPTHLMYAVNRPPLRSDGLPQGKIIPVSQIRQSCQLVPAYPDRSQGVVPPDWTSENVLDKADKLFINNWASMYSYQTMW